MVSILYKQVLSAHTSTFWSYSCYSSENSSGAIKGAVPKFVYNKEELLANPKSAILIIPFLIRIFSGFISQCVIVLLWRKLRPIPI